MQKSKKLTTPEIVYAFLTHYGMFHPFNYPTRWSKLLFGAPPPCRELSYVVLMSLSTSVSDADKLIRSQRQVINLKTVQRPKPEPKEELQSIHSSEGFLLAFGSFCASWHVEMLLKLTSFNCQTARPFELKLKKCQSILWTFLIERRLWNWMRTLV